LDERALFRYMVCVVDVVNVTSIVRSHLNSCYIEISL